MKLYAPAFERNCEPIAGALEQALADATRVLEIGSGTGQHAAWFARRFPQVTWYPTELASNIDSIEAWRRESGLDNLESPRVLDVFEDAWPDCGADAVVTINTLHIMSWPAVEVVVSRGAALLPKGGVLFVYGPFRYAGRELEPSNNRFDAWLRARDPDSGLRPFEDVNRLAAASGMRLVRDLAMPANNRAIWWYKDAG